MRRSKNYIKIKEEHKNRFSLTILFALIVFIILLVSVLLTALVIFILSEFVSIDIFTDNTISATALFLLMSSISIVIGFGVSILAIKFPLKPFNLLITKMNRLASGDFKARLKFSKPYSNMPTFNETSESFNKMAQELENTQMLSSDFINNFSHEIKTPIVSILGFARLLKHGNLSESEKKEYIAIIEEESKRLSHIADSVLSLTRVENKSILTGITEFNLSEQLRSCFLILESKWSQKQLEFSLDFKEYKICANDEMLKEVWINLLDNAIKFTPEKGKISIEIFEAQDTLTVSIHNSGSEISEENIKKVFNKFYQADESHSGMGNGLGLAIVKSIVELHRGTVSADSKNMHTVFHVTLPKKN